MNQQLYFLEIDPYINESVLVEMMAYIPNGKKESMLRYRQDIDRKIHIYSDIFIRCLISVKSGIKYSEIDIKTSRTGKPFLACYPYCEFNISHTRNAVAAALSEKPVGVDIEKVRDIDIRIADKIFSDGELAWLYNSAEDQNLRFFEIWTKKEALVKYYGTGLSNNLKALDVTANTNQEEFFTVTTDGYTISTCSGTQLQENDFIRISEPEFIEMWRKLADR